MIVAAKGKIDAIANDIGKIIVGVISVLAPLFIYASVFFLSISHNLSLMGMGAVAVSELTVALYLLRRSRI